MIALAMIRRPSSASCGGPGVCPHALSKASIIKRTSSGPYSPDLKRASIASVFSLAAWFGPRALAETSCSNGQPALSLGLPVIAVSVLEILPQQHTPDDKGSRSGAAAGGRSPALHYDAAARASRLCAVE